MKGSRLLVAAVSVAAAVGVAAPPTTGVAATSAPLWVKHVQNFSGGISNGVRFSLDPAVHAGPGEVREFRRPCDDDRDIAEQRSDERRQLSAAAAERGVRRVQHRQPAWSPSPARTTT